MLALTVILALGAAGADSAPRRVGEKGAWAKTVGAVHLEGQMITLDEDGRLIGTDLNRGTQRAVGLKKLKGFRMPFAVAGRLFAVSERGVLHEIDVKSGAATPRGGTEWSAASVATGSPTGVVYLARTDGALFSWDPARVTWAQLSVPGASPRFLLTWGPHLYFLEADGTLSSVSRDGVRSSVGRKGSLFGVTAATMQGSKVWATLSSGELVSVDVQTGQRTVAARSGFGTWEHLVNPGGWFLYGIDARGSLWAIKVGEPPPRTR